MRNFIMLSVLLTPMFFLLACSQTTDKQAKPTLISPTNLQWLEEVESPAALAQVAQWNAKSAENFTQDPRFDSMMSNAMAILNAKEKLAYAYADGEYVYNFWQDDQHQRGIVRRANKAQYVAGKAQWQTLLDIDQLAQNEQRDWVVRGLGNLNCYAPTDKNCLLALSDGGKDAVELRELDGQTFSFVQDGFHLPEAKSSVAWVDENHLLVTTDWGEGTMTKAGYPHTVKMLRRGQDLKQAKTILAGSVDDTFVFPSRIKLAGEQYVNTIYLGKTFYKGEYYVVHNQQAKRLPLPAQAKVFFVHQGQLIIQINQDWQVGQQLFQQGSLVALDAQALYGQQQLKNIQVVFQPAANQALHDVAKTADNLIINVLEDVQNKLLLAKFNHESATTWQMQVLSLPENSVIDIYSYDDSAHSMFLSIENMLVPKALYAFDVQTEQLTTLQASPATFDSQQLRLTQKFTNSKDGTRIPYFIVHPKNMPLDGSTPTILYGYGGFEITISPTYKPVIGKLWMEEGNAYVIANIRGGGEYGPAWHQAGLKTKRQVIYDDFIAVAEDLIRTGVTSPQHLGIMGRSNGGLLMGVMFTQRPDLFAAVDCGVPLLDMLRFDQLLAGASWVGEYGSPADPIEGAFLRSISPLHNVKTATDYPAIFFYTATTDDRVHPGHARKMAALLEQHNIDFEYYENDEGGHRGYTNTRDHAYRFVLEYLFFKQHLQ